MWEGIERSDKISALNKILRGQQTARSRMHLFSWDQPDPSLQPRIVAQSMSSASMSKVNRYKQDHKLSQSRCDPYKIKYSRILESTGDEKGNDQLEDMELSPYSKVSKLKSRPSAGRPQKQTSSRFIQSKLPSASTSGQQVNLLSNNNQLPRFINDHLKKKISNIPSETAKKYFQTHPSLLKQRNSPQHIYQLLSQFIAAQRIHLQLPLIKQYRNCVYFGQQVNPTKKYEGFLIFFSSQKLYYGELISEKKNGYGTQIHFTDGIAYSGRFQNGRKKGQFIVVTPKQTYQGQLKNGLYHGYGKLITTTSIYNGYFQNGCRHGQGQQHFPQTNLTICGIFISNRFTNDQHKIEESRINKATAKQHVINNPEELCERQKVSRYRKDHSYKEIGYDLRTKEVIVQNQWNKSNMLRMKGSGPRRRSIEEEDPLFKKMY